MLSEAALQIAAVDCSEAELIVTLKDGRRIAAPLWWLPRLRGATPEQRANWAMMPFGDAVEWRELDEHVSVKGFAARQAGGGRQAASIQTAVVSSRVWVGLAQHDTERHRG